MARHNLSSLRIQGDDLRLHSPHVKDNTSHSNTGPHKAVLGTLFPFLPSEVLRMNILPWPT